MFAPKMGATQELEPPYTYKQALADSLTRHRRRHHEDFDPGIIVWATPCRCVEGTLVLDSTDQRCLRCGRPEVQAALEELLHERVHEDGIEDLWIMIQLTRLSLIEAGEL